MSDSPAAKKLKTVPTGTPLYFDLDLSKLTIDAIPQGANETKFATVKYDEARLVFQASTVKEPMRSPFGIDDGSKFKPSSKPSMKLELQDPQLEFVRAIEEKVITTAIKNKAEYFPGVKPSPSEDDIRGAFSSRVSVDPEGKYPAKLRVNVNLSDEKKKPLKVMTTTLLSSGKIEQPKTGSFNDVEFNDCVVPVLQTAGGVWIKKTKKMGDNLFGLIFEASELLVVKGSKDSSAGAFNLGGVEVASDAEEAENNHEDQSSD